MGLRGPGSNPTPANAQRRNALASIGQKKTVCTVCGQTFTPARAHAKYCSSKCRQQHHRDRRQGKARLRPPLQVLPGGFEPIVLTSEMIDLIITTHEAQATYIGCSRGRCLRGRKKAKDGHCPTCLAYMTAANRLRGIVGTPVWTVSGLPDAAEPPSALVSPKGQAAWRRAWQLRLELIEAAKRKLGEA
jgi:hypothetical protein